MKLSVRQLEVARLLAEGMASKEVADKLGISVRTAEQHRFIVLHKTKSRNVADLTRWAIGEGLLSV